MSRAELLAVLARVKPVKLALIAEDAPLEWLAVPRGRQRWERLIDRTIGDRPWTELRLCDGRGATLEVVTAAREAAAGPEEDDGLDPALEAAAATGDPTARFAALLAGVVRETHRSVTASITETVRTMRTESRAEQAELLAAHQAMARDAFELRAQSEAALAVERDRRLAVETELLELRARFQHEERPDPVDQREAKLLELLTGGKNLPAGDQSQGMPTG